MLPYVEYLKFKLKILGTIRNEFDSGNTLLFRHHFFYFHSFVFFVNGRRLVFNSSKFKIKFKVEILYKF